VLAWLDTHAGAVQALAALATVFLTLALVGATAWYAVLTRRALAATKAEAQAQRRARRRCFFMLASYLEGLVGGLPEVPNETGMREAILWNDDEVGQLLLLAPEVQLEAALPAATAVTSLRWLADRVRRVQGSRSGAGTAWGFLEDWSGQLRNARSALARIAEFVMPADRA
jgi:hypothetical protein